MNDKLTKLCEEVIVAADPMHHRTRTESFASAYKGIKAAPILAKALKLYMELDDPLRDTDEIRAELIALEKELP